jgi:transposase-like protein
MTMKKPTNTKCPVCGSYDIEGGSVEVTPGYAVQEVSCNVCCSTWDDEYMFTGQVNVKPDNAHEEDSE